MAPDDGRKYVLRPEDDGTGTTLGSVPEGYYAPPTFESTVVQAITPCQGWTERTAVLAKLRAYIEKKAIAAQP